MNLLVLEEVRNIYLKRKKENDKKRELKQELDKLKENEDVKRYLEIVSMGKLTVFDELEIVKMIFKSKDVVDRIDSNIYVNAGYYNYSRRFKNRGNYICIDVNKADYCLYKNLVSGKEVKVVIEEAEQFIKENIVIEFDEMFFNRYRYNEIQRMFYNGLLNGCDEEELLEYLVNNQDNYKIKNITGISYTKGKKRELVKKQV